MKFPAPTAQSTSAMDAVARVTAASVAATAREHYGVLAEVSQIAVLALERLEQAATPQEIGKTEIPTGDPDAIKAMLRDIQVTSHGTFLQRHGAEADYQAVGARVTKRHRTAGGRWR